MAVLAVSSHNRRAKGALWGLFHKDAYPICECPTLMNGWMASPTQWTWVWVNSVELVVDREAWQAAVRGVTRSPTRLSDWTELNPRELIAPKAQPMNTLRGGIRFQHMKWGWSWEGGGGVAGGRQEDYTKEHPQSLEAREWENAPQ